MTSRAWPTVVALVTGALLLGACGQAAPVDDGSAVRGTAASPSASEAGSTDTAESGGNVSPTPGAGDTAGSPSGDTASPSDGASQSASGRPDASAEGGGGAAAAGASCGEIERPPLQSGSHLIGDSAPPVPYSSLPPTSGWHASGHMDVAVHGANDRLTEPQQVSVLEAGGVVVAYRGLDAETRAALTRRVDRRYAGRVAVTPYGKLRPGQVAFTSWGRLQRCDGFDVDAFDRFVDRFGPAEPVSVGH